MGKQPDATQGDGVKRPRKSPAAHLEPHRFKKGEVNNPKGRPKNPFPRFMKEAFMDKSGNDTGKTRGQAFIELLYLEAMGVRRPPRGSSVDKTREMLRDGWLGKPKAALELTGSGGGPLRVDLSFMDADTLEKMNNAFTQAMEDDEE